MGTYASGAGAEAINLAAEDERMVNLWKAASLLRLIFTVAAGCVLFLIYQSERPEDVKEFQRFIVAGIIVLLTFGVNLPELIACYGEPQFFACVMPFTEVNRSVDLSRVFQVQR